MAQCFFKNMWVRLSNKKNDSKQHWNDSIEKEKNKGVGTCEEKPPFASMGSGCGWAGALVYWLWEETHVLKVVGSNPSPVYWMDIFHIYLM